MLKRTVAGILMMITFIMGILGILVNLVAGTSAPTDPILGDLSTLVTVCYVIIFIFAMLTLAGAVSALSGKSWGLALMGSIFCMLTPTWLFIGSVLGIVSIVLIAVSQDEFEGYVPPRPAYYPSPPYAPAQSYAPPSQQYQYGGGYDRYGGYDDPYRPRYP